MKMRSSAKRKGIAGILGAVLLFVMLFTVGTSYFIFVNNTNFQYLQALVTRGNSLQSDLYESIQITTLLTNNHVGFYINNTGGINVNVTAMFLLDSSGNVLKCEGKGVPTGASCYASNAAFPLLANSGKGAPSFGVVDSAYTYVGGTNTVKVVTQRGDVFSATYPITVSGLVANALTSGL
ncbi:MAG: hypothetical protein LYZ66_02000 [Nitrososphaerales archaeon]|nr:hypothetical protein [Nitrososphaerales archaeon]